MWAVIRFGLLVFVIGAVLSLLVLPWLDLSWWRIFRRCVSIAAAISLLLSIRVLERRPIRSYGFALRVGGARQFATGILLGAVALALVCGIGLLSGGSHIALQTNPVKFWGTLLGFIPAAALVGVLEELSFRGYIFQNLLKHSRWLAVVASSALYSIVHLKTGTFNSGTALELGGLFLLGVVLSISYLLTKQLYLAAGLHATLAYGARTNKLLLAFHDPSLAWLLGTSRLINGVLSWVALLAIGALMLMVWWIRSPQRGGMDYEQV